MFHLLKQKENYNHILKSIILQLMRSDFKVKLKFKTANKQQLEAINSLNGPLLIVAGPGTGKTFTLINRALNLIVNYGVKPEEILFATTI